MTNGEIEQLKSVKDFDSLIEYLSDVLLWPIDAEKFEDITFDYNPTELGIDKKHAAKIKTIKQIRPLTDTQPWGIFYIEFEPKKLPVVVLRRILRALIHSRRQVDSKLKTWDPPDLIFISALGEANDRKITFAHFSESEQGLPELRTFSWDASDTYLHYLQNTLDLEELRWPANETDAEAWRDQWSSAFTLKHRYVITTSKQLAVEMARYATQIRDQVKAVFEYEIGSGPLHKLFENFKKMLIHDLEIDTFADMYAQTIAYGLFSAKATHEGEFALGDISAIIPNTNPFLKNLFEECTRIGETQKDCLDLDELGVTELVTLLKEVEIEPILQDFGKLKRIEDPVIHFYEDFLKEYDPKQKVKRGIFYTPDSVVSFIVRSVDYLLRTEFECPDGLADTSTITVTHKHTKVTGEVIEEVKQVPKVQILDPATGTGTFLKYVIEEIKKNFDEKHKGFSKDELRKEWNSYVDKHLLPRVFGFELLMAPYAIAHLKLGLKLRDTGYDFSSRQRLGVALTNALESGKESAEKLDSYLGWLAQESIYSNYIKTSKNISVVIGNPPYTNYGMLNRNPWILNLLEDYKKDLNEKKINIDDDYIKFIRFAHWKLQRNGWGVIGLITNNSYIEGITHRIMRKKLYDTFDKIFILNLHGHARIDKDDNVFDIKQGVSIVLLVKPPKPLKEKEVYYFSSLGEGLLTKEEKKHFLFENNVASVPWEHLNPNGPNYWFIGKDLSLGEEYEKGWSLTDIFRLKGSGVKTDRDELFIDFLKQPLKERMTVLFKENWSDDFIEKYKVENSSSYPLLDRIKKINSDSSYIRKIHYRPFDFRSIYYHLGLTSRPAYEIMQHFLAGRNIGLISVRQVAESKSFNHAFVTDEIVDIRITLSSRGTCYVFPLYLYTKHVEDIADKAIKFIKNLNSSSPNREIQLNTNFSDVFNKYITKRYSSVSPEEINNYIYAILYSPEYRDRYFNFLKVNFPRVPFTSDKDLFKTLCKFGSELVSLHLMESPELDNLITEFKGEGDNVVGPIGKNSYKNGKLKINKTQYFEGIPEDVYNFYIGGYQVCEKWLKERKDRTLTDEEIKHYQRIVVAINETIRIMGEIDKVIEEHGGWPVR